MGINPTNTGQVIAGGNPIVGAGLEASTLTSDGVPDDATEGLFTLDATGATAGTYTLTTPNGTTADIAFDADAAAVTAALEAVDGAGSWFFQGVGPVTGSPNDIPPPATAAMLVLDDATTGGVSLVLTSPGSKGAYAPAAVGAVCVDLTTGTYYQNGNSQAVPQWDEMSA